MILSNNPTTLRRREEGDTGRFDEILQFVLSSRPQHAAPGENYGSPGFHQKLDCLAYQRWVAGRPRLYSRVAFYPMNLFLFDFTGQHVARQVEVNRPALAVERFAKRDADVLGNSITKIDAICGLNDRPHHWNLIHLLECVERGAAHWRGSADCYHWGSVSPGVAKTCHKVGDARAHRCDADSGLAGNPRISVRHHRRSLLMAHIDTLHPEVNACAEGTSSRSTHHEEDGVDAFTLERLSDNLFAA